MNSKFIFKRLIALVSLIAIALSAVIGLSACKAKESKQKYTKTYFDYFDTISNVVGYFDNDVQFGVVADLVEERLSEYHKLYDIYNSYDGITNLCDLNRLYDGVHKKLTVDEKIIDMLLFAKEAYTLTDGETNVCLGALLSLWHEKRQEALKSPEKASLPSENDIVTAAFNSDINQLIIDEENRTVFIANPNMTLDVGAVAKGYAVEMIAAELESMGLSGISLSVGGNVRVIGTKPGGEAWIAGITNPDLSSEQEYSALLSISSGALVTSGSYQRYYVVNGKSYHHIIDKDTLYPAAYFASVSVWTANSAMADALSTALFSMTYEDGSALVESLADTEAMWITENGQKLYSSGFIALVRK